MHPDLVPAGGDFYGHVSRSLQPLAARPSAAESVASSSEVLTAPSRLQLDALGTALEGACARRVAVLLQ